LTENKGKAFDPAVLAAFRDEQEVEIETWNAEGGEHRVIIWIMVVDGRPYIRSFRGPGARWYRNVGLDPNAAIHVNGRRVPVRAVAAADPESVAAVSRELLAKYPDDPATPQMVAPAVLGTTLRLESR
jgi:hypothetical protein